MMKKRTLLILAFMLSCQKNSNKNPNEDVKNDKKDEAIEVYVDAAKKQVLADDRILGGWLQAKGQHPLFSQVRGTVGKILIPSGKKAAKGDTVLYVRPDGASWEFKPHPVIVESSGTVLRMIAKQGQRVDSNDPLCEVGDLSGFEVLVQATVEDIKFLQSYASPLDAVFPALSQEVIGEARLEQLDAAANLATGTFSARLIVHCKPGNSVCKERIRPGLLTKIIMPTNKRQGILIAHNHFYGGRQEPYVFVIDKDKKAKKLSIELGQSFGDQMEVTSGLQAGQEYVVSSADPVTEGKALQIKEKEPAQPTSKSETKE